MAGSRRGIDAGDFTRTDLERISFVGFVPVKDLRGMRPIGKALPPDEAGVYVAYRDRDDPPSFLRTNLCGQWDGDKTLPPEDLERRWVPASRVVYIGKADRPTEAAANSLRRRVSAYIRFGAGRNARHAGGYPTWQLQDSADLLIAWRVFEGPLTAPALERQLIGAHLERFRALPFANSASGRDP